MRHSQPDSGPPDFWRSLRAEHRKEMRRAAIRWAVVFGGILSGFLFILWWSASAVHFGASRPARSTAPTWVIRGTARDARTGNPIPWAVISDDFSAGSPTFHSMADHRGVFAHHTLAEPHRIRVTALGYKPSLVQVGRAWYLWMPRGREEVNVSLEPE